MQVISSFIPRASQPRGHIHLDANGPSARSLTINNGYERWLTIAGDGSATIHEGVTEDRAIDALGTGNCAAAIVLVYLRVARAQARERFIRRALIGVALAGFILVPGRLLLSLVAQVIK